ncbi:hypothetical protein Pst134EA_007644 [Puccinia striiformis f. sp. tritici]|uniref:hypothetical protein n=1 Tax=Puccinia striiformis f. sp. tritici TaxID=168172 RepID=UPI0020084CEC|nr:hypothetical protein Pst134EA_007644 [Puccinia striiformis f. sp. tritici]KAH9460575.1 hypothetical protein Pst134EB_008742 [Puccinia striiformis f. sp. tritici]KAH9470382.1 hypothetical protein Pst134EA_007644 [Puccinia striiformis f. sp. tritici]
MRRHWLIRRWRVRNRPSKTNRTRVWMGPRLVRVGHIQGSSNGKTRLIKKRASNDEGISCLDDGIRKGFDYRKTLFYIPETPISWENVEVKKQGSFCPTKNNTPQKHACRNQDVVPPATKTREDRT